MTKTKQTIIKILSVALSVVMLSAALITLSGCGTEPLVEYKITYELDGGTNDADNPETYTTEDFPLAIQNPTKAGYTFLGWTSEIHEIEEPELTLLLGDEQNLTLKAVWAVNLEPGNIRYLLKGGVNSPINPDKFTEAQLPVVINGEPTREGYVFTGWTTATDKKTKRMSVTITKFGFEILTATWDKLMSEGYGNDKLLAPDFEFKDKDGKSVKLSDFRGVKPVLLSFMVTSCSNCRDEIIQAFTPAYNSSLKEVFELVVICADPAGLDSFIKNNGITIPMYTVAGGVSGYTDSLWPKSYMVDKWGYMFNDKRPNADINKSPINNFDYGFIASSGEVSTIVNGAISRANK